MRVRSRTRLARRPAILAAATAAREVESWGRLRTGFEKLIDACASHEVQRIIFVAAPQGVGPDAWHKIELHFAFGVLRSVLASLIAAKIIKPYRFDLGARSLLALLRETSAEVARSQRDRQIRAQIADLVAGIVDALRSR